MKTSMLAFVFFAALAGCTSSRRASVYAPVSEEGIATRGVDPQDYQLVVEKMVSSMLKSGLQAEVGQKPVIELGAIFNRTPYNIETRMLGELIRVEMLKAGSARFSTATDYEHKGGESGDLFKQLTFQNESGHVDSSTVKRYGQLVGADYILFGNIYNIERRAGRVTEANFTFNLTLTEVKTGLVVWSDTKPIRKNII